MTEKELIQGCLNNDRLSQKMLYDKFSGQMYGICLRYCKDDSAAAEALQTGFIRVFKNLDSFRNEGELGAWIRKIIVRSAIDQVKREKISFYDDLSIIDELENSYTMDFSFDSFNYDQLISLLDRLPKGYKMVFSLFVIDELDHSEIAETLGISEATSRTQLFKARKMLQSLISESPLLSYKYH
ncbi:MAG: sigma-70 family RNA polymerase sigma factor [Saprospiraceae bacterium]|nr:sigma-70 family RNA polymerase sigma factor [Saprospiraceae bacterium]